MDKVDSDSLIDQFTEDLRIAGKGRDTLDWYPIGLKQFSRFVDGKLLDITKDNLRAYLDSLRKRNLKQASIIKHFGVLNQFYDYLIYTEIYTLPNQIPAFRKRYLQQYKEGSDASARRCPTTEEVSILVNAILNSRDRAAVILLFKTGMRRKELSELDVSDVDLSKQTITIKKTAKRSNKTVYFDDEAAYVLNRWLKYREKINKTKNPALFLDKFGKRLGLRPIDEIFKRYVRPAGLYKGPGTENALTPHCARHWFTTELLESGMSFEHVQHLRGDKGRESADRYHHIKEKELQEEYNRCVPKLGII